MRIYFQASKTEAAQQAFKELTQRYGQTKTPRSADVIAALGGDGETLHALQSAVRYGKPVFGLNFGHKGFLQNLHKKDEDLIARIQKAEAIELSPLCVEAKLLNGDIRGDIRRAFAINEVHICNRIRGELIYMKVFIDGREYVPRLGADGLIISTTVGSTGYNKSARGPVLPLGNDLIAFTPNNAYTPDRMRASVIRPYPLTINVFDPEFRIADVHADSKCIARKVQSVSISLDTSKNYKLLFDPGYSLHEKIMRTQFSTPEIA